MSLETELRDALTERAATVESTVTDPYARVHAAVATNRRRRRAVAAASFVAVAALAVGVPTVTSRLGDGPGVTVPATRPSLPGADSPVWRSIGSWPLRGGLAGDRGLVDAIEKKLEGRAIFVEDVGATRLALVVTGDQLSVLTGPLGSGAEGLSVTTSGPVREAGTENVLTLAGQGELVVLASPALTSAEISGTPAIALDGTVSRTWQPIGLTDGIGRSRAVPLTQVRAGASMGRPWYTFGEGDRPDEPSACAGACGADDLAAFQEREVDAEVARAMVLDVGRVDTTTTYRAEVPTDIAAGVVGDLPDGARSVVQVLLSTLPGGQVLRTVVVRTDAVGQSSSWDVERLNPVSASTAQERPVVIATTGKDDGSPLTAWVLAPAGSTVRAVSPQPSVWPTSGLVPVRGGVARIEIPVDNATFEQNYSIELRDADGAILGTWPATPGTAELSAP